MLAGRWSGHERSVLPLPEGLGRLQAALMEWMPGQPLMSRDNIDSMRTPNVASPTLPGLDTLGIEATRMESVMPEAMSDWHMALRLDVWRRQTHRT